MAKITIFRPDGPKSYDQVDISSIENGVVMFSIPEGTDAFQTHSVTTNLPFIIEGEAK